MIHAAVHKNNKIIKIIRVPSKEALSKNCDEGEDVTIIPGEVDPDAYFISDGLCVKKQPFPRLDYLRNTTVGAQMGVAGLPVGTEVIWPDGVTTTETDGRAHCRAPHIGKFTFVLIHPECLTQEVAIYVGA